MNEIPGYIHSSFNGAGHIEQFGSAEEAFEKLTEDHNLHPHSAIHALRSVLGEQIFAMLTEGREFLSKVEILRNIRRSPEG